MKKVRLLVAWVVLICAAAVLAPGDSATGVAGISVAPGVFGTPQVPEASAEHELFSAFREARMSLPVKREPVTLVAVGDVMLSRGVADRIREHEDSGLPFVKAKGFLRTGDIVFGNLEAPLTSGREIDIPEMVLRADPEMAYALADAGFTLLSLANNHIPDFGSSGILDTLQNLDRAGIARVGAGPDAAEAYAPRIIEARGLRLAFLAFTDPDMAPPSYGAGDESPGTAFMDVSKMEAAIRDARLAADFVVVSLHAGTEYESEPDDRQVESAHAAIDAGANLVLGHHPHVVQPVELYRDRYIIYSLGNFVFDQWWSKETCQGVIARLTIGQAGLERFEFLPVLINKDAQPEIMTGPEASAVLSKLKLDLTEVTMSPLYDTEGATTGRFGYIDLDREPDLSQGTNPARRNGPPPHFRLLKDQSLDLDQDGVLDEFTLRDGRLTVRTASNLAWEMPKTWWVDDFVLGDANNDGVTDLNLIVWKSGSFGPYKPFWVTEDDPSVKNHLFIFDLVNGTMKSIWQSSNLDCPNYEIEPVDLDGDGQNELLAIEGDYDDPQVKRTSVWKWSDWGFYKVSSAL